MITATATEVQNNFGRYLQAVQNGEEILILKNGKEAARLISRDKAATSITESLSGICKCDNLDYKREKENALKEKYGV